MENSLSCVNATNGARVYNDGSVMLCCLSMHKLTNTQNEEANINVDTIEEIRTGPKAQEIIHALSNGIKHPNCSRCWDEEKAGIESKRVRDNANYTFDNNILKIIELNLGTVCNLKCRICGPWSSNQWNTEYLSLDVENKINRTVYDVWTHNLTSSYADDSLFWSEYEKILPELIQINVYGGEPFLVKKQWEVLQLSVDNGYSKYQTIDFNTNCTVFNLQQLELFKHFKSVRISCSIDDIGDRFEYQRHPAKWNIVLANLLKFKKYQEDYNFELNVCVTVNNYNIFKIDEVFRFLIYNNIPFYTNYLHDPPNYNILHLHPEIKKYITNKFKNTEFATDYGRTCMTAILEYMNSQKYNRLHWNYFITVVDILDNLRGESFSNVFPEYYVLIQQYKENAPASGASNE